MASATAPQPILQATSRVASLVVLISGSGTNLQAIIDSCSNGKLKNKAQVTHVVSNRSSAKGLERAANHNIASTVHNIIKYKREHGEVKGRTLYDQDLAKILIDLKPDLIVCAGWMHILSAATLKPLQDNNISIINLHPALPGAFDGKDAIARAFTAFKAKQIQFTGVMVHFVELEVDRGPVILQKNIEVLDTDSIDDLETRVHQVEHCVIVDGIELALQRL